MIRKKRNEVLETGIEVWREEGKEGGREELAQRFSSPLVGPRRVITPGLLFQRAFVSAATQCELPSRGKLNFPLLSLSFQSFPPEISLSSILFLFLIWLLKVSRDIFLIYEWKIWIFGGLVVFGLE